MEQGTQATLPAPISPVPQLAPVLPPLATAPHERGKTVTGCKCDACEKLRRKWRDKDAKRRAANPFAKPAGAVDGVPAPVSGEAGIAPPASSPKPVVPWTVDLVRPLVAQIADLLEAMDIETIAKEADKLSERCGKFVRANFRWNAPGKLAVVEGGSECVVKYLNMAGVSAEYAPEIKTALGAIAIWNGRQSMLAEIRKMRDEDKAEAEKKAKAQAEQLAKAE